MFQVVIRSLQKQIDQSNQKQDRSNIDRILMDRITGEVSSDSQANKVNTEERMNLNAVTEQERMQNPQQTSRGVENIPNSLEDLFNREDVAVVRSQNLVMNDELMQSMNHAQNLVQESETMNIDQKLVAQILVYRSCINNNVDD